MSCRNAFSLAFIFFVALTTLSAAGRDVRLVDAARRNDADAVRVLLKQGVDVNARHADGATALLWATHWNDFETVDLLIAAGARINAADDHGVTPLMLASENVSNTR